MKSLQVCTTLAVLLTVACTSTRGPCVNPPIVFVHGFTGSTLVSAAGEKMWLGATTALGLRTPNLSLPTRFSSGTQARDGLHATAPLDKVSLLPGLVEKKIYQPFLEAMRQGSHAFHPFAYDWRRDNFEALEQLKVYVQQVRAKHAGAKVRLVAHSMGGLIGLGLLNAQPEAIADVVFAGVPFEGGIGLLQELHAGNRVGLNNQVLGPAVVATFAAAYTFFPEDGHGLVAADGTPIPMDFFDPACWKQQQLGMFAVGRKDAADPNHAQLYALLRQILPRARQFRQLLISRKDLTYPPILVVSGRAQPSLMKLVRQGPKSIHGWDFSCAPQDLGDGRVSLANSRPYRGIPHTVMTSARSHADLLNDPAVISAIVQPTLPQNNPW